MSSGTHFSHNRVLASLSEHSSRVIAQSLEFVELPQHFQIAVSGEAVDHVFFPISGVGSVRIRNQDGRPSEAGMFGFEGFSPTIVAVGGLISTHDVVVLASGEGYRIHRSALADVIERDRDFERVLLRYIYVFATQLSYTALANAAYKIDARLARWLLMYQDRARSDTINISHEFIATMLAVRRPSITVALHELEGEHIIKSSRKELVIRNRRRLEAIAGKSYGAPEREYAMLFDVKRSKGESTVIDEAFAGRRRR